MVQNPLGPALFNSMNWPHLSARFKSHWSQYKNYINYFLIFWILLQKHFGSELLTTRFPTSQDLTITPYLFVEIKKLLRLFFSAKCYSFALTNSLMTCNIVCLQFFSFKGLLVAYHLIYYPSKLSEIKGILSNPIL